MSSTNFQPILSSDFPGYEEFASKVLCPIFNMYYQSLPADDILYSYGDNNPMAEKAHIRSIVRKATISPTDGYANFDPIEVYDITMDDNCRLAQSRVGIQQYIRSINFQSSHAFLVFHYGTVEGRSWRFSYFYKKETIASITDSKRYTYLFGQGISARTAHERFNELLKITSANRELGLKQEGNNIHVFTNKDIIDAFSVEALSDEFFYKYLGYYASFVKYLTGKPTAKESGKYAIKDATFRRVVVDMDGLGLKDDKDQFHNSFLPHYNNDEEKCEKAIRDYVKKMMGRVVFLHFLQKKGKKGWMCGDKDFMYHLFENSPLKDDFLDRVLEPLFFVILNTNPDDRIDVCRRHNDNIKWERNRLVEWDEDLVESWRDIPYLNGGLFEQEEIDKCRSVFPAEYFEKLLDFFRQYNFTIDENDPNDMEVGVDPEMLSKIFENLLEDNKEKGAFYTPKEIVHYMCSESLIAYLNQQCEGDEWNEEVIRRFVSDPLANEHFTANQQQVLIDALTRVKICDPAIGSGAFPMGMLNLITRCRHALESTPVSEIKRHIIQHNIYGVDIEQGAVDIARLRFWLSLIVDEVTPHALPNLDYRIVRGNSLLTTFCGEYLDLSEMKDGRTRLAKMRQQLAVMQDEYYSLNGEAKWRKEIEIKRLLLAIANEYFGAEKDKLRIESFHDYDLYKETSSKTKKQLAEAYKLYERKAKCQQLIENILVSLGGNKTVHERARIDVDFFDWEIMFSNVFAEAKGGFDIVIGNPPYLRIQGIRKDNPDFADFLVDLFKTTTGKFDLYVAFIEKGYQLCCKHGLLNFIMPTKWTNSDYGLGMRSFMIEEKPYIKMVNFSSFQVFNASTYTGIQWFVKDTVGSMDYVQLSQDVATPNELDDFLKSLNQKDFTSYNYLNFSSMPWKLTSNQSSSDIISKLSKLPKLKNILKYISQGTVTVGDDIFVMKGHFDGDNFIGYS